MKTNVVGNRFAVVVFDKPQNLLRTFLIAVECPVNKFHRLCAA